MGFYLDHNATTPMCDQAISAMDVIHRTVCGNASSVHLMGAEARQFLEGARESLAGMIGCEPGELYFTSGGTEANNWALHGILADRQDWGIIHSAVEHKSILKTCKAIAFQRVIDRIAVDEDGIVDVDNLETVLRRRYRDYLVSIMLANNETGVIQPIEAVVTSVRRLRPKSLIHVDAVQAFGKIPVDVKDLDVDLMTISAHKLGGPVGIGALYVRKGVEIAPMIVGGHQEHDRRAGTENVAAAVGFQVAASRRDRRLKSGEYTNAVHTHMGHLLLLLNEGLDGYWINGGDRDRLPNTVNIGFEGVDSDALVLMLSGHGVFVSNGSACEAGSDEGSHVLRAMGQDDEKSRSAIRFSFSDDLPEGAIQEIAKHVISTVELLRGMSKIDIPDSIA